MTDAGCVSVRQKSGQPSQAVTGTEPLRGQTSISPSTARARSRTRSAMVMMAATPRRRPRDATRRGSAPFHGHYLAEKRFSPRRGSHGHPPSRPESRASHVRCPDGAGAERWRRTPTMGSPPPRDGRRRPRGASTSAGRSQDGPEGCDPGELKESSCHQHHRSRPPRGRDQATLFGSHSALIQTPRGIG